MDYINAIIEVMEQSEVDFNIKVRYIISINRACGVEAATKTLDLLADLKSKYICGIELSGDPRSGKFEDF